jgi:hypothetical protein
MATATMSLADAISRQNELIRAGEYNERSGTGGFRVLGRLIELRHERPAEGQVPARDITDKVGLSLDWKHFHNGPLLGMDRSCTQLLVISKVGPLPDIPDPNWKLGQFVELDGNLIPLASIPAEMRATLKNRDGSSVSGLDREQEKPPMRAQHFIEHASGTWGSYLVIRPLTQALYKIDGLVGMNLIDFSSSIGEGNSPAFLLDPATGEGHFLGGQFHLR